MLEILIKENKMDEIEKKYSEEGIEWIIKESLAYVNFLSYIKIKGIDGIMLKEPNFSLIYIFLLFENKINVKDYISIIKFENKIKIKKIDRLSNENLDRVKEVYFKKVLFCDTHFALRYGFELFYRDKKEFFKISIALALLSGWEKCAYTIAYLKLFEKIKNSTTREMLTEIYIRFISSFPTNLKEINLKGKLESVPLNTFSLIYKKMMDIYEKDYQGIINDEHKSILSLLNLDSTCKIDDKVVMFSKII